jgi:hypothetical protein
VRHLTGDWGELDEHDWRKNKLSVEYRLANRLLLIGTGVRIWAMTEATREATVLLLPEEYWLLW